MHLPCLRRIFKSDKHKVLQRAEITGIEYMLTQQQLKSVGHVTRVDKICLPKQVLYSQLLDAPKKAAGQKLRFKDTLRHNLQNIGIDHKNWEI